MVEFAWTSPLAGILQAAGDVSAPLRFEEVRRSLYGIAPHVGRSDAVSAALRGFCGLELPPPGRFVEANGVTCLWSGLDSWMLAGPVSAAAPGCSDLARALDGQAAVVDLGDGRAVLRLSGAPATRVLGRLCGVDLHPRQFGPGRCAATRIARVAAHLLCVDDAPTYEIQVGRAVAADVLGEILEAAAEYPIRTVSPGSA